MNKSNHRSPFAIVGRLIVLVKPMLPIMLAAIVMGVAGHFCATFITIFGGFGILRALGLASPLKTVSTAFACILVFALLRGVLRYAEQASNHYIAFKLLALIRDKVFGALRRLTPAKLEGRDQSNSRRAVEAGHARPAALPYMPFYIRCRAGHVRPLQGNGPNKETPTCQSSSPVHF